MKDTFGPWRLFDVLLIAHAKSFLGTQMNGSEKEIEYASENKMKGESSSSSSSPSERCAAERSYFFR